MVPSSDSRVLGLRHWQLANLHLTTWSVYVPDSFVWEALKAVISTTVISKEVDKVKYVVVHYASLKFSRRTSGLFSNSMKFVSTMLA